MADFENLSPETTAFVDSNNNIQDIQDILESGAVVVTAVAPAPVTPIGTATIPKFENISPWAGKFVNPSNEIIDLLDLLTSGAISVQVSGGGAAVDSVFGRTGVVVAVNGDYSFTQISGVAAETQGGTAQSTYATGDIIYSSAVNTLSKLSIGTEGRVLQVSSGIPSWEVSASAPVTSVFGRTGVVVAVSGDYSFDEITGLPVTATAGTVMQGSGSAWQEATIASGTGMSISNISGTITFTNALPDQTVSISNSNGLSVGGVYPNFTVGLSAPVSSANGGTNQTTYATGDLIHASAADTLSKISIGSAGQVLTVVTGDVSWVTPSGGAVDSVFGRTGVVVAVNGDYNESEISPSFVLVTTSTQALSVSTKYHTTFAGLCTMTLPVSAIVGSSIKIIAGNSGNTFRVAQNAGQQIFFGALLGVSQETTVGVGGNLESTDPNTCVELVCIVADTTWSVVSCINSISGV